MIEMEQGKYYVVEVKQFEANVLHRTIVRCLSKENVVHFILYEGYVRKNHKDVYHFKVISEIEDMQI